MVLPAVVPPCLRRLGCQHGARGCFTPKNTLLYGNVLTTQRCAAVWCVVWCVSLSPGPSLVCVSGWTRLGASTCPVLSCQHWTAALCRWVGVLWVGLRGGGLCTAARAMYAYVPASAGNAFCSLSIHTCMQSSSFAGPPFECHSPLSHCHPPTTPGCSCAHDPPRPLPSPGHSRGRTRDNQPAPADSSNQAWARSAVLCVF